MSYNLSSFEIIEIKNLVLPTEAVMGFDHEVTMRDEISTFEFDSDTCTIAGSNDDEILRVSKIDWYSEFSGHQYEEVLKPLLTRSQGVLVALCVWEGGDSVQILKSDDGEIKEIGLVEFLKSDAVDFDDEEFNA